MKKVLLAVPFAMMLTACGTPTVEELATDQDLFKEAAQECMEMGHDAMDSELCKNVGQAAVIAAQNAMKAAY